MPSTSGCVGISPHLYFKEIEFMYKFPYVIYADFESILIKKNLQLSTKTKQIQEHRASGFAMIVIENEDKIFYKYVYRGTDCLAVFMKELKMLLFRIEGILSIVRDMVITEKQQKDFENCDICYLCENYIDPSKGDEKVRDHDHLTGLYRGVAHSSCNIKYQLPKKYHCFSIT